MATEGLFMLIVFSAVMSIASFAAGMLPLSVSLSQSQIRLLSAIGMGVLVGTSLIVIIPEGIETLYHAAAAPPPRTSTTQPPAALFHRSLLSRSASEPSPPGSHVDTHEAQHHETSSPAHGYVGLSLISGFLMMYLIDVLPNYAQQTPSREPHHISLDNLRTLSPSPSDGPPSAGHTTTLGLVIHAAADGIALGASATSSNLALGAIVFLAIMLHKAPAAFGLTAVLLRSGLGKRQARAHLIVFSLAAPVGAIVTWILVRILGSNPDAMQWWTGILLLFSGGTFLYVAMHNMQEQSAEGKASSASGGTSFTQVGAATFGMLIPLLAELGHARAHGN